MIEADDQDPDDEVYLQYDPTGNSASVGFTYHNQRDCKHFRNNENPKTFSRKGAQIRWKSPCLGCVLTEYSQDDFE